MVCGILQLIGDEELNLSKEDKGEVIILSYQVTFKDLVGVQDVRIYGTELEVRSLSDKLRLLIFKAFSKYISDKGIKTLHPVYELTPEELQTYLVLTAKNRRNGGLTLEAEIRVS